MTVVVSVFQTGAAAQERLRVELRAPESIRPVLERHLRILNRPDQTMPEETADRIVLIRRTRREIADLLATEGYFTPQVNIERDESSLWRLEVEPGPQSMITNVTIAFEGHLAAGDDGGRDRRRAELAGAWMLPAGQPFRQAAWDAAKQQLLDGAARRDYAAARMSASRAEVDPDAATVTLAVTVDSGPPFFLGPLELTGLERLPEDLVARYSMLEVGERFDQERLLALQSALQNSPQFASVTVDVERDPALADAVPVRIHVTEAQSRHLAFGAGFSTNTGARTEVNWRDVNFRGRGWELSTGLRLEQRRQSLYADIFLPPAQARHRDSFGAVAENSDIEGLRITRQAIGAVRSKQRGDIETAVSLRYQHENVRPKGVDASSRNALTANWSWIQRKVDDVLDPREGYVLHVELGGGSRALLSDQDFVRTYARFVRYQPVGERDVFIVRAEAGATVAKSRDGIPQDFLFRTGGSQSVRGYAYESLGVQEGQATLGGRFLGTASAEYVHWFRPQWGVAAFVDAGDAADDRDSFDLKVGYGVGARWRSPAGPLALDLAYGQGDKRLRVHLSIAIAF
ncbi:MAG TPA: BamA/TamA family outer membrane protein [Rhodocyclaceae bacterium]|nr:BamA/TamA family outer membrane protein [Rhodocyclaceae bacterium]HRQ48671.1 BamA/TamA family outer membrane protein [Rhodocyclaceae bacterium]